MMQSSLAWVMSPCETLRSIPPIDRDPSDFEDGTLTHPFSSARIINTHKYLQYNFNGYKYLKMCSIFLQRSFGTDYSKVVLLLIYLYVDSLFCLLLCCFWLTLAG